MKLRNNANATNEDGNITDASELNYGQKLFNYGMARYNQNDNYHGYFFSINNVSGPGFMINVGGITITDPFVAESRKKAFAFVINYYIENNSSFPLSQKNMIKIGVCIHEMGHQIIINDHSYHHNVYPETQGCCIVKQPWVFNGSTCGDNLSFCTYHKCLLYNLTY